MASHPPSQPPVLVFDLDGTVLSVNSFRNWVRYLLRGRFGGLNPLTRAQLAAQTGWVMMQRKLLRHDHVRTKARLQQLWGAALARDPQAEAQTLLIAELQATVRPNLQPLLRAVAARDYDAILATAASGDYALPLADSLGFHHVLATPALHGAQAGQQNVGAAKRDRVLAYLAEQGWEQRPRIFFTDHAEDLPLIRACDKSFWLGPPEHYAAARDQAEGKPLIAATSLAAGEILAHITP